MEGVVPINKTAMILMGVSLTSVLASGCAAKTVSSHQTHNTHTKSATAKSSTLASVSSIHMVNRNQGWAFTKDGVFTTQNGGVSWSNVSPHDLAENVQLFGDFLDLKDASVAYPNPVTFGEALETTIYSTKNAGGTWNKSTISGGSVKSVDFINSQTGWMLLFRGATAIKEHDLIMQTTDGGQHWNQVSQTSKTTPTDQPGVLPLSGDKAGVGFVSSTTGWVTGYSPVNGKIYLYKTMNDGKAWNLQSVPVPQKWVGNLFMVVSPKFYSSQVGILPIENLNGTVIFYYTQNGGISWQPTTPVAWVFGDNLAWDFFDSKRGFFIDGKLLKRTTNGGKSWSTVTPNINFSNVTELDFVSKKDGWAVTSGGELYKTTDAGKDWLKS